MDTVALPEKDLTRLVRLCGMFSSSFDGERANAAAMADKLLKERGLTWEKALFSIAARPEPRRVWDEPHYTSDIAYECLKWPEPLTDWELEFLRSVAGRSRLTEKQRRVLARIEKKCRTYAMSGGVHDEF
ncbi:MAG: hypothetical protein EOM20_15660 [Spartobacteria bacterium]|nr:hypothetical protein [Spartobacteria bacterium]